MRVVVTWETAGHSPRGCHPTVPCVLWVGSAWAQQLSVSIFQLRVALLGVERRICCPFTVKVEPTERSVWHRQASPAARSHGPYVLHADHCPASPQGSADVWDGSVVLSESAPHFPSWAPCLRCTTWGAFATLPESPGRCDLRQMERRCS